MRLPSFFSPFPPPPPGQVQRGARVWVSQLDERGEWALGQLYQEPEKAGTWLDCYWATDPLFLEIVRVFWGSRSFFGEIVRFFGVLGIELTKC